MGGAGGERAGLAWKGRGGKEEAGPVRKGAGAARKGAGPPPRLPLVGEAGHWAATLRAVGSGTGQRHWEHWAVTEP